MKKVSILVVSVLIALLCACGQEADPGAVHIPETTASVTEPELTGEELYHNFLANLHKRLNAIVGDDTHLDGLSSEEGMVGVAEIASISKTQLLNDVGYAIFDMNHDDVPELILCEVDELTDTSCKGTRILCVYTLEDNKMALLYEGTSRNCHYILENDRLFNVIADSVFGVYEFEDTDSKVSCVDFYFMQLNESQQPEYWHNQLGIQDVAASQSLDGGADTFENLLSEHMTAVKSVDLIPMVRFQ